MSTLDQAFIRAYNKDRRAAASSPSKLAHTNPTSQVAPTTLPDAVDPRMTPASQANTQIQSATHSYPAPSSESAAQSTAQTENTAAAAGRWYRVDAAGNLHTRHQRMGEPGEVVYHEPMPNRDTQTTSEVTRSESSSANIQSRHASHRLPPYPHLNPMANADADANVNLATSHTGRRTLASYLAQNQPSIDSIAEETNTPATSPIASPTIEEEKPARTISQEAARSTLKMPAVGHFRTTRTDRPVIAETETAKAKFAAVPFQTAWEVDSLDWPEIQAKLMQEQERAFSKVAAHFCDACHQGLQVLLVTSPTAKEGRSTVASCIARSVAQRGIRVALLDGDIETPSLADSLNLDIAQGWNDAIVEGLPLEEVAIHSIADQLTVLPLTANESSPKLAHIDRYIGAVLERLRESFDLIVIDATFINSLDNRMIGTESNETIDAMILVTDGRIAESQRMETAIRRIKNLGISSVGIVENFTST
jgi:Mrp family chromosome partitioning ATPase